jgi:hypothetical protein
VTIFYCLRFKTTQPGGPGPRIYIPQEQDDPVIPPGTGLSLIAYFPLIRHGSHRKRRLQQCFVTTGTGLPSRSIAMKGGIHFTKPLPSNDMCDTHTDTQTDGRDL